MQHCTAVCSFFRTLHVVFSVYLCCQVCDVFVNQPCTKQPCEYAKSVIFMMLCPVWFNEAEHAQQNLVVHSWEYAQPLPATKQNRDANTWPRSSIVWRWKGVVCSVPKLLLPLASCIQPVMRRMSRSMSLEHWVLSIESSTCVFDELTPAQCDSSPTCAERHDFRVALAIAAHQLRVWDPHANCWS